MFEINDYDAYTSRMKLGLYDKCWWIDKVLPQVDTVIDFGCANGDLHDMIESIAPGRFKYIGIESNRAYFSTLDKRKIFHAFSIKHISDGYIPWDRTVVVMNSVIHEIFNYSDPWKLTEIMEYLIDKGVAHIAIRDMYYRVDKFPNDYWSANAFLNVRYGCDYREKIGNNELGIDYCNSHRVKDFQDLLEFFLKYKYVENWPRESNEKYFWDWLDKIDVFVGPEAPLKMEYIDFFTILPQIRDIERDFDIKWCKEVTTHAKVLLTTNKE